MTSATISRISIQRSIAFLSAFLLMTGCSDTPPVQQASAAPPKWMQEQKPVEISPEVKALVEKEDPDLTKNLSEAEVRAALAAVQQRDVAAPQQPASLNLRPSEEWSKLSEEQKRRSENYERQLDQVVYIGPNMQYHTAFCDTLQVDVTENGLTRRRFIGSNTTIRRAKENGRTRHADCGAPIAEYRYN